MQYLLIHDGLAYEGSDNVIGMGRAARLHGPARLRHISPEALMGMSPSYVRGRCNSLLKGILQFTKLVCGCAKLIHHQSGECGFGVRCKHQVALAIRHVLLRHLPPVPVAARWTKVCGCVDFVVGGVLCGGVLPRLFDAAFSGFTALGGAAAAAAPHVPEDDVDIAE